MAANLGFQGEERIVMPGINAKMNELQAAMGLLGLEIIEREFEKRKLLTEAYRARLGDVPGITCRRDMAGVKHNYYNFVITVDEDEFGMSRDKLYDDLKEFNIFTRKYFYPLCSQFQCYKDLPSSAAHNLPVAERITMMVLSLPMYGKLSIADVERICDVIQFVRKGQSPEIKHLQLTDLEAVA